MALQNAATGTSVHAGLALAGASTNDTSIGDLGRRLLAAAVRRVQSLLHEVGAGVFDSYRPELHYMRGPGPKWRAKHGMTTRSRRG
jgi:hypothetical protein